METSLPEADAKVFQNRRSFLAACSTLGIAGTLLPGLLWGRIATVAPPEVTPDLIDEMCQLCGLDVSADERAAMVNTFNSQLRSLESGVDPMGETVS